MSASVHAKTEHGGHVGPNHSGALGHGDNAIGSAIRRPGANRRFWPGIGGHDGAGQIRDTVFIQSAGQGGNGRFYRFDGERGRR